MKLLCSFYSNIHYFNFFIIKAYLSFLGLIAAVLRKQIREDVAAAASDVYKRPLLAETEACRHSQHHPHGLGQQRPLPKVASDDEPTKDRLYLQISTKYSHFWNLNNKHSGSIPAKYSYAWLPRKCDYQADRQTDRWTDTGQRDPYVPLCFAGDTKTPIHCTAIIQRVLL